jgi:hypothetical protein
MFTQNDTLRDFHGITAWHKAGYTGKGMVAGLGEDFIGDGKSSHAYQTYEVLKEVAPDCDVAYVSTHGIVDENYMLEQTNLMRQLNVCAWSISQGMMTPDNEPLSYAVEKSRPYERVKDFCTCFCAVGNERENAVADLVKVPYVYGVGAIKLLYGEPTPEHFSSHSAADLDFCVCDRWHMSSGDLSGTSFSSPALEGMTALVQQFFKEKTGKALSSEAMYRFLKDNTVDFWYDGKDSKTGWGYIVLPDPATIRVEDYIVTNEEIEAKVAAASTWAQDAWRKAILKGITDGTNPQGDITREQVVVMLDRLGVLK